MTKHATLETEASFQESSFSGSMILCSVLKFLCSGVKFYMGFLFPNSPSQRNKLAQGMSLESFMDQFAFEFGDLKGDCGGMVPLACAVLSEDLQMLGLTIEFLYSWNRIMYCSRDNWVYP